MSEGRENEIWADVQNENLINNGYVKKVILGVRHWVVLLNWRKRVEGGNHVRCSKVHVWNAEGDRGEIQWEGGWRPWEIQKLSERAKEVKKKELDGGGGG